MERGNAEGDTTGMPEPTKILLDESELPRRWYNLIPDLPMPPPPALHPATREPAGPDDFAPLFPMALIGQEVTQESYVDIPEEVLDVYRLWRPTPLYRARRLEKTLGTPARIYYKYEGVSPVGSHKPNTAVPQVFYNAQEGIRRLTTETGAGQWGSALAFACALFGVECEIWQVRASYDSKPYRKSMMETYGATVHPSPSDVTEIGRKILGDDPETPGSLGIAISEAVEIAAKHEDTRYSLGSVLNHVLMHQTVIGQEALAQLAIVGETPDVIFGCTGGGSNFGGLAFPFLREKLAGRMDPRIVAVEPAACPSLTRGRYTYDYGDTAGMTPLLKMHTLGHDFVPEPIHAGGLRYHGMSPLMSHVYELGLIEAVAKNQNECFAAGVQFARTEGIVPAPEPTHAVAACIDEARRCVETGEEKVILTALCGHGHFDMSAYDRYLAGDLPDYEYPAEAVEQALTRLPDVDL
jgi:tryptophan synthase beta chain